MNFSEQSIGLPQFTDITATSDYASSGPEHIQVNAIYTTAAESNSNTKQILVSSPSKFQNAVLNWPDTTSLIQICEKQGIQTISLPTYSQSNMPNIINVQSQSSQLMKDSIVEAGGKTDIPITPNCSTANSSALQQQSIVMAEYIQKLQNTATPITLHQFMKIQTDPVRKDKIVEEQKSNEQSQILNIPTVPIPTSLISLNPSDVNVHIEEPQSQEPLVVTTGSSKVDQNIQGEGSRPEKKIKFRAKTGEIKVTIALDGSTLYCCPECSLAFAQKSDIEQHLQIHIQERKYQCKECGAMLKRKEHLDQHMRGHSDERPFKCPVCSKGFKRNEHLTRHYVIHSGDKNFSCAVCSKAFSRKDHLNKHTQTHLGIKKTKIKKEVIFLDTKDNNTEKDSDTSESISRQQVNTFVKDSNLFKQESTILHHIQNLQKESNLIQTFSAFKEHFLRDGATHQAVNMNEILPQNTRYMMPS